jgi:hypothetical protein
VLIDASAAPDIICIIHRVNIIPEPTERHKDFHRSTLKIPKYKIPTADGIISISDSLNLNLQRLRIFCDLLLISTPISGNACHNIMTVIDEETGLNKPNHSSINNNNTTGDDSETSGRITGDSRKLTNVSLNSTNVSESEYLDYVSEMSPLRQHHHQSHNTVEVAPLPNTSYGGTSAFEPPKYPLRRLPSDESINTVTALPGMVIRCHSINIASNRRRGEGTCIIRPSTTKVVSSWCTLSIGSFDVQ